MRTHYLVYTTLSLLIPFTASALGMTVMIDGRAVVMSDVPESAWYAQYVAAAAEAGIVSGYKDEYGKPTGKFGPSNSITIAEALKIAVEGAGYDEQEFASVIDSGIRNHWASPYVSVAKSQNFELEIRSSNLDRPATRAQVASLFTSAFQVQMEWASFARYTDVTASTQFGGAIEQLSADGVVSGDTDIEGQPTGTFRPNDPINRAEVAKMIMKARDVYGAPGDGTTPDEETATNDEDAVVSYDGEKFSPGVLRVKEGTTVIFRNDSTYPLWVASDPHPYHDEYEGFDAEQELSQGETYSFTFNRVGTWNYHNHVSDWQAGTVVVE